MLYCCMYPTGVGAASMRATHNDSWRYIQDCCALNMRGLSLKSNLRMYMRKGYISNIEDGSTTEVYG